MATPFSFINDTSVDLNEVCLHITYLLLKELVFVSDVFLLFICCLIAGSGIKSLFTRIDSSSDTAVSSTQLIYSFMSCFLSVCLFYCHCYYFVFQIDRLEPSFTDSVFLFRFRFCSHLRDSVSVFRFLIPCFSAAVENSRSL